MPRKWLGAAAWSAKEAKVGDRLPYARLIDEKAGYTEFRTVPCRRAADPSLAAFLAPPQATNA